MDNSEQQNYTELFNLLTIVKYDLIGFVDSMIYFLRNPFKNNIPLYQKYKDIHTRIAQYRQYFEYLDLDDNDFYNYALQKNSHIDIILIRDELIQKTNSVIPDNVSNFINVFTYFCLNQDLNQIGGVVNSNTNLLEYSKTNSNASGSSGQIYFNTYKNINGSEKQVAIKKQKIKLSDFNDEINMYDYFNRLDIGPKILKSVHNNNENGVYVLEKYTSDVNQLMKDYILTSDQTIYLEKNISNMINTMIANESGYICTDIKFGNILVNYVADENKNILEISKIVLHDFDNFYCHKKIKHRELRPEYNTPVHISKIYKIFKCIVLLSLIISQINSIMNEKKNI